MAALFSRVLARSVLIVAIPTALAAQVRDFPIKGEIKSPQEVIDGVITLSDEIHNPEKFQLRIGNKVLCYGFVLALTNKTFNGSFACSNAHAAEFTALYDGKVLVGKGMMGKRPFTIEFGISTPSSPTPPNGSDFQNKP
ncbi:hypothetical protein [Microvirga puerhi]|uniref:Uncharacterized protein n=1 Tax=Microvirga puerhi TaxID=2876078 RepID=A0ABS7VPS3_9HYPH|nr:hypothetical protein [Microvirga puerhi]MBZ6077017.1 hypothetical protein [Microvirga puerhi]